MAGVSLNSDWQQMSGSSAGCVFAVPHDLMAALHDKQPPLFYDVGMMGNAWQAIQHEDCLFILRQTVLAFTVGAHSCMGARFARRRDRGGRKTAGLVSV